MGKKPGTAFPTILHVQGRVRSAYVSAQSDQSLRGHSVGSQGYKVPSGGGRDFDCADSQAGPSF